MPRGTATHCPNGHEYTEENVYLNTRGTRRCRTCQRINVKKYKDRQEEVRIHSSDISIDIQELVRHGKCLVKKCSVTMEGHPRCVTCSIAVGDAHLAQRLIKNQCEDCHAFEREQRARFRGKRGELARSASRATLTESNRARK